MLVGGGRVVWGVDRGWMPLPTLPQRYCDPVSFVPTRYSEILIVVILNDVLSNVRTIKSKSRIHHRRETTAVSRQRVG